MVPFLRISKAIRTWIAPDSSVLPESSASVRGSDFLEQIYEIAEGLAYLHERGVIHGDIKGMNVLISAHLRVLVCDFGLAKAANSATATSLVGVGSLRWQAPELLGGGTKTEKSDVYAFGITVAEVSSDSCDR